MSAGVITTPEEPDEGAGLTELYVISSDADLCKRVDSFILNSNWDLEDPKLLAITDYLINNHLFFFREESANLIQTLKYFIYCYINGFNPFSNSYSEEISLSPKSYTNLNELKKRYGKVFYNEQERKIAVGHFTGRCRRLSPKEP